MNSAHEKYALLSVTDKSGLVDFAKGLIECGFTVLSTGGSAAALQNAGVPVTEVATYTGSPEILDGRVKTLHPKLHGGILFERDNPKHEAQVREHGIKPISLVAVNLYAFEKNAKAKGLNVAEAIQHIDVGGPAMLRAAAKNYAHCLVVPTVADYQIVLEKLRTNSVTLEFRCALAAKTFSLVAEYDQMIGAYLASTSAEIKQAEPPLPTDPTPPLNLQHKLALRLRYGENPHQTAGFYTQSGELPFVCLQGKELSYNNLLDLDAAVALTQNAHSALGVPCVAIVKHNSPCGVAVGVDGTSPLCEIFQQSLLCDNRSAFGGIVACTSPIDDVTAEAMAAIFLECIAAPSFSAAALKIFASKKNLRLVQIPNNFVADRSQVRSALGGVLAQASDQTLAASSTWTLGAGHAADAMTLRDLSLADIIAKHAKSNAVAFVKNGAALAIGCGQTSRIDAAMFALQRAEKIHGRAVLSGAAMGSDAFFPFRDCVDFVAKYGVSAIAQPGGSVRDQESCDAAKEHGMTMYFTGMRHFRH